MNLVDYISAVLFKKRPAFGLKLHIIPGPSREYRQQMKLVLKKRYFLFRFISAAKNFLKRHHFFPIFD